MIELTDITKSALPCDMVLVGKLLAIFKNVKKPLTANEVLTEMVKRKVHEDDLPSYSDVIWTLRMLEYFGQVTSQMEKLSAGNHPKFRLVSIS